jgi:hypothetical protein
MDKKGQPGNFFRAALGQICRRRELAGGENQFYCLMLMRVCSI